ncbi:MAG: hypothetical protein ACKO1N_03700 [Erythrobacter sp.]
MNQRLLLLPLLALAVPALQGCVAVVPALADSTMLGTDVLRERVTEGEDRVETAPVASVPAPAAAIAIPAPVPTQVASAAMPAAVPAVVEPTLPPVPASVPTPVSAPKPASVAPTPQPTAAVPAAGVAAVVAPLRAYPDPDRPLAADQFGFARFVRYAQASARGAQSGADLPSAVLIDPVALDGKRRRCVPGEQPVALIDLDPSGGVFAPPAKPDKLPNLALGLAVLREAGIEVAWFSDLSTNLSGNLRAALEQSGLDPRGEDIVSLRRDEDDTKQKRKENLAGITCIVAIAGDDRADFDERYKYLRNPAAGAGLEPLIGDGWFLIEPLLATKGQ